MNKSNNIRFVETDQKIKTALFSLLAKKKYNDVSIKEICEKAGINRSSFYAHYDDINDLMLKTERTLSLKIAKIFDPQIKWTNEIFVELFEFLYENRDFYRSYLCANEQMFMEVSDFKNFVGALNDNCNNLGFDETERIYHMAFFAGGIKALVKSWISSGCKETPEQLAQILKNEYVVNSRNFK